CALSEDPDLDFIGAFLQSDKSRDIGEFLAFELGSLAIESGLEAWSSLKRFLSKPPRELPLPPPATASPAAQSPPASPGKGKDARQSPPTALPAPGAGEAEKADKAIVG